MSEAARAAIDRRPVDHGPDFDQLRAPGVVERLRVRSSRARMRVVERIAPRFPVKSSERLIAGVPVLVVDPSTGVAPNVADRVLINLPGGAFVVADHRAGGLLESMTLAARGGYRVISVGYRQGPECVFPAATEDVAAVYAEIIQTYSPENIGIFGCSAGGLLAAQSVVWFQRTGLPNPGAIQLHSAGADALWGGDAWFWQKPLRGLDTPPSLPERFYYGDHDPTDPLMSPIASLDALRAFPPTILFTGTRSEDLSAVAQTHRLLVRAGVVTELHVWDGIGHGISPEWPEGEEMLDLQLAFFSRHLGRR